MPPIFIYTKPVVDCLVYYYMAWPPHIHKSPPSVRSVTRTLSLGFLFCSFTPRSARADLETVSILLNLGHSPLSAVCLLCRSSFHLKACSWDPTATTILTGNVTLSPAPKSRTFVLANAIALVVLHTGHISRTSSKKSAL